MKAIVTGSGALIGPECVSVLCAEGWEVVGVDNDMRREFFGEAGSTRAVLDDLAKLPGYRPTFADIWDRQTIRGLFERERPGFIIHAAAPPSHAKAPSIPYDDFHGNAGG